MPKFSCRNFPETEILETEILETEILETEILETIEFPVRHFSIHASTSTIER